jgi:hypothetical protein
MKQLVVLYFIALSTPALAELPSGARQIMLKSTSESVEIGTVTFSGEGDQRSITVSMNETLFTDHFLSMRPFKCLEGATRFYCHLPYPYEWQGKITTTDLTDLEYALLFVQKAPTAYGINLWNGIYYQLTLGADGQIAGVLNEVDMDTLASPPATGNFRPLTDEALTPAAADSQWLPIVVIE